MRIAFLCTLSIVCRPSLPPVPERAAECWNAFRHAARKLALGLHREAARTQDKATFAQADRVYQMLARFADDEDAYETNFFWAERLWTLERWKDAAERYTRVVAARPTGRYAREAAYAAMLAWKNVPVPDDDRLCQGPRRRQRFNRGDDCGRSAVEPIPEAREKLIAAIRTYAKLVPDTPYMAAMLYRAACIYYDHGRFDRAEPLFLEVVEKHTKHELAEASAGLYLDALVWECKSREVVAAAGKFLDMPELHHDEGYTQELIPIVSDVSGSGCR